ncbi:LPS-assembly protein LptD [Candidatus Magnetaquicoccus inordinatus]|uniref:LPS-assembly protein LptD n=1 Tax=Candidatus Magnetaquicoccus inordinatus TaxID=2496818 RepID=UPI00102AAC47|nr:LPS assembly protein LptD [Candidatus Magnetaquicoccus inordinatus]
MLLKRYNSPACGPQRRHKRRSLLHSLSCFCLLAMSAHPAAVLSGDKTPKAQINNEKNTPVDVEADGLDIDQARRIISATGNVRLVQTGILELTADQAQYHVHEKQILANGKVQLKRRGDLFKGENALFDFAKDVGTLEKADINLRGAGNLIKAEHAQFHSEGEGRDYLHLQNASFTNCECDPAPWHFTSPEVEIDREKNRITGKDVKLYAGDVPVLALPWWRQPLLPIRESGFLMPNFRVSSNGLEVEQPYYWNIAPNRDATFALREMTSRGLMGSGQLRYLEPGYHGQIDFKGLYDTKNEEYRGLALLNHKQKIEDWQLKAHFEGSRTRDFINDFEQKLVEPSSRRLESTATVERNWQSGSSFSQLQSGINWYQDLEQKNDDHTVQNLPFLYASDSRLLKSISALEHAEPLSWGRWRLDSEARLDNFYQLAGDITQRLDMSPTVRVEKPVSIGTVSATFGIRETAYLLNGDPNQTGTDRRETLHRESATASMRVDSILSRNFDNGLLHTLEPSVQYVVNKASNQDQLPNYDASLRNFSTTGIFAQNLYSGTDRISDVQWLSYSMRSRLLRHQEGENSLWDHILLTVGQRWAPEGNRQFQDGNAFSSIVSGMDVKVNQDISSSLAVGYNPYHDTVESADMNLTMALAEKERRRTLMGSETEYLRLGYHLSDPTATGAAPITVPTLAGWSSLTGLPVSLVESSRVREQDLIVDTSTKISENWYWNQKADYSLETNGLKSWRTGFLYEHSCWSVLLTGGRNLSNSTSTHGGDFIGLFINLQGLGGVGI